MRYVPYVLCAGLILSWPLGQGAAAEIAGGETCTKGIFWPFVRNQGDCLTDVERANGRTGVYQDGDAPAEAAAPAPSLPASSQPASSQAASPQPAGVPASSAASSAPAPVMTGEAPAAIPASAGQAAPAAAPVLDENNCRKGILWPFVREPGDCLTDVEIANGRRGTYQ